MSTTVTGPALRPRAYFLVLAGLAIAGGVAEATVYQAVRRVHGFAWSGLDAFWATPIAYLAFFTALGLPLALLWYARPRWATPRAMLAPFLFLGSYLLLLVAFATSLHWAARTLLAAGFAWQCAGPLARWAGANLPRLRAVTGVLLLALGLAGGRSAWVPIWRAWRAYATYPARHGGPNVLLIILDTVRARSMSLYGYHRETTPNLSQWAERGVVFDSAMAPAPWTLPSHASIFTGHKYRDFQADFLVPFGDSLPVLAEVFTRAGFRTGGFVANWFYTSRESGLSRGFLVYRALRRTSKQVMLHSALGQLVLVKPRWHYKREHDVDRKTAWVISHEASTWIAEPSDRPFFAFLNYFDTHKPYTLPGTGYPRFTGGSRGDRLKYDLSLWYLDRELGALFQSLDQRGVLENTIVVVTADHGEQFGERGLQGHANSLYSPLLHVPLLMFGPGIPAGGHMARPVDIRMIGRTVLELAGVRDSLIEGTSLAACWRQPRCGWPDTVAVGAALAHREGAAPDDTAGGRPSVSVLLDGWEYVRLPSGHEELFRPGADTLADNNQAHDPALAGVVTRLRAAAREYELPGTPAPRVSP